MKAVPSAGAAFPFGGAGTAPMREAGLIAEVQISSGVAARKVTFELTN